MPTSSRDQALHEPTPYKSPFDKDVPKEGIPAIIYIDNNIEGFYWKVYDLQKKVWPALLKDAMRPTIPLDRFKTKLKGRKKDDPIAKLSRAIADTVMEQAKFEEIWRTNNGGYPTWYAEKYPEAEAATRKKKHEYLDATNEWLKEWKTNLDQLG